MTEGREGFDLWIVVSEHTLIECSVCSISDGNSTVGEIGEETVRESG